MRNFQKKFFRWDPKMPLKSFPASAGMLAIIHTALFGKLACLDWLGNFKHTFPTPFGVLSKKFFWRLLTEVNSRGFYYNELDS